jgi:hypothetical protein
MMINIVLPYSNSALVEETINKSKFRSSVQSCDLSTIMYRRALRSLLGLPIIRWLSGKQLKPAKLPLLKGRHSQD